MLGAGLFAANLSTTFRLRKFGMTDKVPYTITLKMEGGEEGEATARDKLLLRTLLGRVCNFVVLPALLC